MRGEDEEKTYTQPTKHNSVNADRREEKVRQQKSPRKKCVGGGDAGSHLSAPVGITSPHPRRPCVKRHGRSPDLQRLSRQRAFPVRPSGICADSQLLTVAGQLPIYTAFPVSSPGGGNHDGDGKEQSTGVKLHRMEENGKRSMQMTMESRICFCSGAE